MTHSIGINTTCEAKAKDRKLQRLVGQDVSNIDGHIVHFGLPIKLQLVKNKLKICSHHSFLFFPKSSINPFKPNRMFNLYSLFRLYDLLFILGGYFVASVL